MKTSVQFSLSMLLVLQAVKYYRRLGIIYDAVCLYLCVVLKPCDLLLKTNIQQCNVGMKEPGLYYSAI